VSNKPKGLSSKEDVLNPQQLDNLFMVCNRLVDKLIVCTLAFGGLRVSELCHMRRDWLNFDENTITIPLRQYCDCWECQHKTEDRKGIWRPKTKKGAREILIHPLLPPVLTEFFATRDSIGLTRQRVWQRLKKLARQAGILHNVYPHALRATAATILAHEKISAPALQYVLGWSRLSSAEEYVQRVASHNWWKFDLAIS